MNNFQDLLTELIIFLEKKETALPNNTRFLTIVWVRSSYLFLPSYSHFAAKPGFQKSGNPPSNVKPCLEPIPLSEKGLLPEDYIMEDPDSHFIYVCTKVDESVELSNKSAEPLAEDLLLESLSLGKDWFFKSRGLKLAETMYAYWRIYFCYLGL